MKQTIAATGLVTLLATAASAEEHSADACINKTYDNIVSEFSKITQPATIMPHLYGLSAESRYSSAFTRGVTTACETMTGDQSTLEGDVTKQAGIMTFVFEAP